jgi:NADH dehydrogenase FAD-containing subunit
MCPIQPLLQEHVIVIGDTASFDQDGRPLPGVALVAMQQGRYAAKSIFRQVTKKSQLPPFRQKQPRRCR